MIISITGPSGAGKEYVKKALLQKLPFLKELCWTTTRPLRPGEIHGVTRESVLREEFIRLEGLGIFCLVQELFGNLYGIRREFLKSNAEIVLTELHIDNLIEMRTQGLDLLAIGLVPVEISFLKERLERRGTESPSEVADRLRSAEIEVGKINQHRELFSYIVEITRRNEDTVAEKVYAFLNTQQTNWKTRKQ